MTFYQKIPEVTVAVCFFPCSQCRLGTLCLPFAVTQAGKARIGTIEWQRITVLSKGEKVARQQAPLGGGRIAVGPANECFSRVKVTGEVRNSVRFGENCP